MSAIFFKKDANKKNLLDIDSSKLGREQRKCGWEEDVHFSVEKGEFDCPPSQGREGDDKTLRNEDPCQKG